jgi:hypothetical protein
MARKMELNGNTLVRYPINALELITSFYTLWGIA